MLCYFIDRALSLNLTPLTTLVRDPTNNKVIKSRQIYIPDTTTIDTFLNPFPPLSNNESTNQNEQKIKDQLLNQFYKLVILDLVIYQGDRNKHNFGITTDKPLPSVVAFDNAFSLPGAITPNISNSKISLITEDYTNVLVNKLNLKQEGWKQFLKQNIKIKDKMKKFMNPMDEEFKQEALKHMSPQKLDSLSDRIEQILNIINKP